VLFSFCGAATHFLSKRVRFRASKRKAAGGRFSRRETWSVTDFWSQAVLGEQKTICSMSQQLQKEKLAFRFGEKHFSIKVEK